MNETPKRKGFKRNLKTNNNNNNNTSEVNENKLDKEQQREEQEQEEQENEKERKEKKDKQKIIQSKIIERKRKEIEIVKEDLDEQYLSSLNEVNEFVNVSFGDQTDGKYDFNKINWEYSSERQGNHFLFVEDPKTGLLISAPIEGSNNSNLLTLSTENREEEDEETQLLASLHSPIHDNSTDHLLGPEIDSSFSNIITQILYLFFEGILAGFSLTLPFLIYQSSSNTDLLINYSESSNEIRRFFFILTSISIVGSLDTLIGAYHTTQNTSLHLLQQSTNSSQSFQPPSTSFLQNSSSSPLSSSSNGTNVSWKSVLFPASIVTFFSFFICFIISYLMAPTEVLMAHHNGISGSDWAEIALQDTSFKDRFDRWKSLASTRVVFALIGWIGSCYTVFIYRLLSLETKEDTVKLWDHITGLKQRINGLQGDFFPSDITPSQLKQLIRIQKLGAERAEAVLKTLERNNNNNN